MHSEVVAPLQLFDPDAEVAVTNRRLPHWAQAGTLCFITWRTWDSIPRPLLDDWLRDRAAWLARYGLDPSSGGWRAALNRLSYDRRTEYHAEFSGRLTRLLDDCHGACVLRRPECAKIVADALTHFDGERYSLFDFVVMPNHVHVLATFSDEQRMLDQCEGWKHYTAVRLNKVLGRAGRFWQVDGFDRLIRTEEQFAAVRRYIADNPGLAGLRAGEFVHYSKSLGDGVIAIRNGHSRSE